MKATMVDVQLSIELSAFLWMSQRKMAMVVNRLDINVSDVPKFVAACYNICEIQRPKAYYKTGKRACTTTAKLRNGAINSSFHNIIATVWERAPGPVQCLCACTVSAAIGARNAPSNISCQPV